MNLLDILSQLDVSLSLTELGNVLLPVNGTLLGLVYAGLIYWLDGGLSKLEFTRSILEDSLIADGKVLLDLLVGASIISLFAVIDSRGLASISFWIFAIAFSIDLLKSISEHGYIKTIFGSATISSQAPPFFQFIAKLRNAGYVGLFRFLFFAVPILLLPILINLNTGSFWVLSDASIKIHIIIVTIFALIQVRSLLTQAFEVRKQLNQQTSSSNVNSAVTLSDDKEVWSKEQITLEKTLLQELLESANIYTVYTREDLLEKPDWTSRDLNPEQAPILKWQPNPGKHGNYHMNLVIPYLENNKMTRDYIFAWTRHIFILLAKSNTSAPTFAVSFYRKDEYGEDHLALFRGVKSTINSKKDKVQSDLEFIKLFKGRFITEEIAEIS